jgi:ribonucleoside-diphosphate reductase beta chain
MFEYSKAFKPMVYPEFWDAYMAHFKTMWVPEEVRMADDIIDWNTRLTDKQKALLSNIFRFFVTGDMDVSSGYLDHLIPLVKNIQARAMLVSFADREFIHVRSYAYLIDSLGMPDRLYKEFRQYKEMTAKHEFVFKPLVGFDEYETLIANLALFSGGAEGLQLFSSFAILLSFGKDHLLKETMQIIRFSSLDESHHVNGNMLLLNKTKELYPHAWNEKVKTHVIDTIKEMVKLEDDFVELCFSTGEAAYNLTAEQVKGFVRHLADTRLKQMGLMPIYDVENPLPWVDEIINGVNFANFFERGVVEYAMGSGTGSWSTPYDNNLFSKEAIIKHFKAGDVS